MTVHYTPEDVTSLGRAIAALETLQAIMERSRVYNVELQLAIDDLTSLRDRMLAEQQQVRDRLAARTTFPKLQEVS